MAVGRTNLRNATQVSSGVLQAPIHQATVVFCTMVGYATLLAWDKDLATQALAIYNDTATRLLKTSGANLSLLLGPLVKIPLPTNHTDHLHLCVHKCVCHSTVRHADLQCVQAVIPFDSQPGAHVTTPLGCLCCCRH